MKKIIFLLPLCVCFFFVSAQSYKKLHFKSILVDTHNDIPAKVVERNLIFDQDLRGKTHTDLNRMNKGGIDAQFFSIWCDGKEPQPFLMANRQIDSVVAWTARNAGKLRAATSATEIRSAAARKKIAVLLGVEGGHMIENDLNNLQALYNRGARYMTLTWNNSTGWATSAADETTKADSLKHRGLTDFGEQVVYRMNKIGMMVDLSHVGEQTFNDVMKITSKPVLVSHSCVYELCKHWRNLKDEQLKAIGKNGGVIQLNFFSGFIDSAYDRKVKRFTASHKKEMDSLLKINPKNYLMLEYLVAKYPDELNSLRPPLGMLLDHLDYIVKMIGIDHVGLGSDFDGVSSLPRELDDVTAFPAITKMLVERGYSKKNIRKILGGNILRVFKRNQPS